MINFQWPWLLLCLPLPLLVYWLPAKKQSMGAALKMPLFIQGFNSVKQQQSNSKASLWILSICWGLLVLASARPQWLGDPINIPSKSREMMIAVDLSGSMRIEDMELNGNAVNRLDMLKVVLGDFIERRHGDRLGLILFADDAYMQTPMTFDISTVKQMLEEAVLGLVGQKTAIGDAIALAVKRFDMKKDSNKVLILLTDGQNTAGKISPEQALDLAVAKNVTIYSIGIGADAMLERSLFGVRKINPSSDLDEKMLSNLAKKTHGKYFRAKDTQGMSEIYQALDKLEPVKQDEQQMRPLTALYYWPLALAMLLGFAYIAWLTFGHTLFPYQPSNTGK